MMETQRVLIAHHEGASHREHALNGDAQSIGIEMFGFGRRLLRLRSYEIGNHQNGARLSQRTDSDKCVGVLAKRLFIIVDRL
jgi:hypothetical protein